MSSMMVFKKHLPRRTFLRGLGATIALPLLDGMVPAFAGVRNANAQPVRRLGAIYLPNGMNMAQWTPSAEGAAFELPPILEPLAAVRDRVLVLSSLSSAEADQRPGEGSGDHSRSSAAFLTGVHAKKTEGADILNGMSMDQIAAREMGKHTQLASLELGLEANDLAGGCEQGYSCAYSGTIAWRSPTTPLPMENNPRAVFERLFGSSETTDPRERVMRLQMDRSILDAVNAELVHLREELGAHDRGKVTEYLESVRDIERRIQIAEEQSNREMPVVEQPSGIPAAFDEHAKLMFDLMVLAYQCDLTRVSTFAYGREKSGRTYPEVGVPEPHHPISHHQNRPGLLEKLTKINIFHMTMFAYFMQKLRSTADGDGSLLDHVMIIYGAGMSNSDTHFHHDLPILLVGGGAGQIKGGRHLRVPVGTPLTNLHMTLLGKMGVPAEHLGDSTGTIELLSAV